MEHSSTQTQAIQDQNAFWKLAAELHRGGQWAYLWTKSPDGAKRTHWYRAGTRPDKARVLPSSLDVYFSVHPLARGGYETTRGAIETVAAVNCLFAEFDVKDYGAQTAIFAHLRSLPVLPTATIDSGSGGLHCYWIFTDTLPIASEEMRQFCRQMQSAWVNYVGSDKGAKGLTQVLRVPGTLNHKYTPAGAVRLVGMDLERRYSAPELLGLCFDAFNALCLEDEPRRADTVPDTERAAGLASDQDRINAMLQHDPVGRALWAGDMTAFGNDHSCADIALCRRLRFYAEGNPALIDRLFRLSALYRPKWERADYRDRTIAAALRNWDGEYWQPRPPADHEAIEAALSAVRD